MRLSTSLVAALTALAAAAGLAATPAQAEVADRFRAGETYTGTFADPTVMKVGHTYVAAATTVANLNLPIMTSTDLKTWVPRPALPNFRDYSSWAGYNDAMPIKSSWAATAKRREKVELMSQWAPSLAQVGDHYVAAYSAAVRLEPRHSCIGIATADTPLGVYRDRSDDPLVCYRKAPLGAIDPDVFVDPDTGKAFLLWKQEGIPGVQSPMLRSRRLSPSGTRFKRGSDTHVLATRDQRWEGHVVENPSMVEFEGRFYLFYSGNAWRTGDYATGYAVCEGPRGPCTKPDDEPLLASGGKVAGPGGADAFLDGDGRLRLAYAAWTTGAVGPARGYRRLGVATVDAGDNGRLAVTDRR